MVGKDDQEVKLETVKDAVTDLKLERQSSTESVVLNGISDTVAPKDEVNGHVLPSTPNLKPSKSRNRSSTAVAKDGLSEEKIGGDITVKQELGQPPKLARSASQKLTARVAPLFNDLPDQTTEAASTFQVMEACTYANKFMGYTEHAMDCDCAEEWDPSTSKNAACGEDSDCINRATKMECVGDCGCGDSCQNQRFQRREYAKVSVIKTEKKGYGLRADCDLRSHEFIFEYIGEVINEPQFRRRMIQYDEEGIKHFYFMSLNKGEFVDATKKGNLGRFCNHSCNPNCYVDKWVVGEKLRMGIFAERYIKAGEELVFNYNVDRYGADPQPCYCGEPNCTGFIGGKTQTERATKLSNATIEALGIDSPDGWDTAVAKRPRKKKTGEEDEEYVDSLQPKSLDENGVTKVMAALMQCKEKWIAVKLLGRIQRCEDERVRHRVVRMHGYQILNSQLNTWKDDFNVVLQILDILDKFPRLTRNKIIDSKIEETVKPLKGCDDERVVEKATALLEVWSALEVGYRIPRMKRDPTAINTTTATHHYERRETTKDESKDKSKSRSRSRSRSRSVDVTRNAPRGPAALTRGGKLHLKSYRPGPRPFRRPYNPLPKGWFAAESNGRTYYYSASGETTWVRPTVPAAQPPPPPKRELKEKTLQDIIDGIMNAKENTPKTKDKSATPATPADVKAPEKKEHKEKWRSYSEEKRKKLYENTLFPHVKHIVDKFKHKLPKEDLKRYAKEVAKKLVNSDFKNNRVDDPTKISDKQVKQVKKYCKEYFEKAVAKHRAYEEKKAERKTKETSKTATSRSIEKTEKAPAQRPSRYGGPSEPNDEDSDVQLSDAEIDDATEGRDPAYRDALKRKRAVDRDLENDNEDGTASPAKRQRSTSPLIIPPPPPPMSPSNLMFDDAFGESLKHKQTEDLDDEGYGDTDPSPGKWQRSETPPPPPPPPPPADISPGNIENGEEEQDDDATQELYHGEEDELQSSSGLPAQQQSISNHSPLPSPTEGYPHS
ncbi:histone methyltransferase set2 [Emydomyces testavorans]|uniref:Histone-lysine N-methyltransferase, H3 lysine-36 specific n=1 Tax=Emydomyces testavorans TaxID=2070801 RepID=A0AAF0IJ52_9EURO|nr:histone methyltransferase set2 [Emydomyces testavorans]